MARSAADLSFAALQTAYIERNETAYIERNETGSSNTESADV